GPSSPVHPQTLHLITLMEMSPESLAAWATAFGSLVSAVALVQSRTWLSVFGAAMLMVAIVALLYARHERRLISSAAVRLGGRNLDSLNIASLRRELNRSLVIDAADHVAEIEGANLAVSWRYSGYCRSDRESVFVFSVDTDNFIPFDELHCFAYDMMRDAER